MAQIAEASRDGFSTPVAILTFNRPELTARLLAILARVKPRSILVVSDGPRAHVASDLEKCAAVRRLFERLDWKCEVKRNFADQNMGSFPRNSTGLTWVFDQVEEAIILEDDCHPDLSFFPYCEELLDRYRNDTRIGLISGNNFLKPTKNEQSPSYFFSRYATAWGWASWRRTWRQVDFDMPYWPEIRDSGRLRRSLYSASEERYWRIVYGMIYEKQRKNAWDYQLMLTCRQFDLLTAVPSVNLVSNVGYGPDATHCTDANNLWGDIMSHELRFPLTHPKKIEASRQVDYRIFRRRFHMYWWLRNSKRVPGLFPLLKALLA